MRLKQFIKNQRKVAISIRISGMGLNIHILDMLIMVRAIKVNNSIINLNIFIPKIPTATSLKILVINKVKLHKSVKKIGQKVLNCEIVPN